MTRQTNATILVALVLLIGLPGLCLAQGQAPATAATATMTTATETGQAAGTSVPATPGDTKTQGSISIGALVNDNSGDLTHVARYDVAHQGTLPQIGFQFWGSRSGVAYDVSAFNGGSSLDQTYRARLNANRVLDVRVDYDRFQRRIDHDPLTYLDASVGNFVVRHDDTDPAAKYGVGRGELNARATVSIPGLDWLKLYASHRQEGRSGHRQSLAVSHCANCHVVGHTRAVDELTRDTTVGARLHFPRLTVDYSLLNRSFEDRAAAPVTTYDRALHPVSVADVFGNRVSYDAKNGPLAFDTTPSSKKTSQSLKANVNLPSDVSIQGTYTRSSVTNEDQDFGIDFTGASGRLVVPIGNKALFRASLRHYEIAADSVFVDIAEPVAASGPLAGLTYAQAYPTFGSPDYDTESSLARTPTEAAFELTYRPFKRSSLRAEYSYEQVNREFGEVEKTTTNSFRFSFRSRPARSLNVRFRVDGDWVTDPFTHVRGAVPTLIVTTPSVGGLPFVATQYFEMYRSRAADLTSFPTRNVATDTGITWSPVPRLSMTAHYRYRNASNDELNYGTWSQASHLPGAELWFAPTDRTALSVGYTYQRERLETMFSTLAFGG